MTPTPAAETAAAAGTPPAEDFAALLDESLGDFRAFERTVVKGTVVAVEGDMALVDVGLKSEGRVPLREFAEAGQEARIAVGDGVEVFVERLEDRNGEAVLSRERAKREETWEKLEQAFKDSSHVKGAIFGRVKGGFTVDLSGAVAFLPGSQVDIRPVRDITPLLGTPQPFLILKMDRSRGNIVVSRRSVLEETRATERAELIKNLKEGQVLSGVVKNITDYGAFVDLGGVDGLLHVTDIAWRRINHPSEALSISQTVEVQVIRFNRETQRISLGMKQLQPDPWEGVENRYPAATRYRGRVTNITDYGAFVELEPGIEGLVHVSEMSWTKKNVHPGKIVSTSQEVEVMVLDVDPNKRRISLGLKQCLANPWTEFADGHPAGTVVSGEIRNITEFGLFVGLPGDIDGMVHMSDISWEKSPEDAIQGYRKGDRVDVQVLDVDTGKERISLGIRQLEKDPFAAATAGLRKGSVVTCTVAAVQDSGIDVSVGGGAAGFIRRSDLGRDRTEQRPDRFAVGEKVDAKITQIDRSGRRVTLSIKAREIEEEKQAMAEYGSTDSGASLGDILGAALRRKQDQQADDEAAAAATDAETGAKAAADTETDADADAGAGTDAAAPAAAGTATDDADAADATDAADGGTDAGADGSDAAAAAEAAEAATDSDGAGEAAGETAEETAEETAGAAPRQKKKDAT